VIDGNSSYTGIEKQNFLANLELYKKDNELLHLTKEKKLLEDEFVVLKNLVGHEKKHDRHVDDNYRSMVLRRLLMNLKVPTLTFICFQIFQLCVVTFN